MERGTYAAASAGIAQLAKIQVVTHNLANVDTPGYKRQALIGDTQTFEETLAARIAGNDPYARGDHERTPGISSVKTVIDFSQGPVQTTGNPFDVALARENDFFVVQAADGPRYTRAGNFTLNTDGEIVTQDGLQVLSDEGEIVVTPGGVAKFEANGALSVDDQEIGKLQTVHFEDTSGLVPDGGSRFKLQDGSPQPVSAVTQVIPGAVEASNVSAINSIIDLITTNRGFEQYTKAASSIDALNRLAVSQLGRE